MKEELGGTWTRPTLFRIGASGLLGDIGRRATERYATAHRNPIA